MLNYVLVDDGNAPCYLGLRPGRFYSICRGCKRTYENRRKRKCAELPEVPEM